MAEGIDHNGINERYTKMAKLIESKNALVAVLDNDSIIKLDADKLDINAFSNNCDDVDQDWDNEKTIINFEDGEALTFDSYLDATLEDANGMLLQQAN
jgi:hypothetical protein